MTKLTRKQIEQIIKDAQASGKSPDFSGMDLSRVNLSRVNLSGANLRETNLTKTNLEETDLRWANLSGTKLIRANLTGANLSEADLSGADLGRTNLHRAYLNGVDLNRANLTEAIVAYTTFADVDLSLVKGLDTVEHYGPSSIDTHTLSRSRGKIPKAFLRGAGVANTFISYIDSLTNLPIQYYSCFISYSHTVSTGFEGVISFPNSSLGMHLSFSRSQTPVSLATSGHPSAQDRLWMDIHNH